MLIECPKVSSTPPDLRKMVDTLCKAESEPKRLYYDVNKSYCEKIRGASDMECDPEHAPSNVTRQIKDIKLKDSHWIGVTQNVVCNCPVT